MSPAHLLAEIATGPDVLDTIPEEDLPDLLAELERLRSRVWIRLHASRPQVETNGKPPEAPDRMLSVAEAAERLAVSVDWLYRRSDSLPFVRKLSDRTLRFSERGIERWLEAKRDQ